MRILSRRRILSSIAITATFAAAWMPAAQAASAKPSIRVTADGTQPVFSYQEAIKEYVNVQSSVDSDGDGRKDLIRVDIIRPKESDEGLKVPVIMDESPYYDNLGRGNESERKTYDADGNPAKFPLFYDNYFVPRGYAVLDVDMDGTTKSDGCPTSGGASDVLGGKAVVDWLNGRAKAFDADGKRVEATWTTGRTAMIGKSYDGTLANGVAATGVKGLETIVPISAISSWYDYSRINGTVLTRGEEDGLADTVDTDPPAKCASMQQQLAAGQDDATGNYNAFWAERDYRDGTVANVRKVHAAVFATHGLGDLNVKPSQFSTWWSALAEQGVPRKVWLSQYGHVDPFDYRRDVWVDTLHQWFDHWLWRIPNDVMQQPRADVETGPDQWATQKDWPAPGATPVTLHPRANGSLSLGAGSGTGTYTDTLLAEDTAVTAPDTSAPGRLAYTTPPLAHDLRISGTPKVSLSVRLDKPTANLGALLVDYGTDTRVDYLGAGEGVKTLSTEDCHGQSTDVDDACYKQVVTDTVTSDVNVVARGYIDAQNRLSLSHPAPLTPGRAASVKWDTLPQDYTFKTGHRLALVLIGTDSDVQSDRATGATVSVGLAGSGITLPVAPPARSASAGPLFAPQRAWQGPPRVDLPRPHRSFH